MKQYILIGHKPEPCDDLIAWARWYGKNNRIIDQTWITKKVLVSTIFLGVDYNFNDQGPPVLFETRVFRIEKPKMYLGGFMLDRKSLDQYFNRYQTFDQARTFHKITVSLVEQSLRHRIKKRKKESLRFEQKHGIHSL